MLLSSCRLLLLDKVCVVLSELPGITLMEKLLQQFLSLISGVFKLLAGCRYRSAERSKKAGIEIGSLSKDHLYCS